MALPAFKRVFDSSGIEAIQRNVYVILTSLALQVYICLNFKYFHLITLSLLVISAELATHTRYRFLAIHTEQTDLVAVCPNSLFSMDFNLRRKYLCRRQWITWNQTGLLRKHVSASNLSTSFCFQVYYYIKKLPRPQQYKSPELVRLNDHMRHPSFSAFVLLFWVSPTMRWWNVTYCWIVCYQELITVWTVRSWRRFSVVTCTWRGGLITLITDTKRFSTGENFTSCSVCSVQCTISCI